MAKAKKGYSAAEKRAFKAGMAAQYRMSCVGNSKSKSSGRTTGKGRGGRR